MIYLDPATYGYGNYGMPYANSRQFTSTLQTVGRGQYEPYNQTGPVGVSLTYHWTGFLLSEFRKLWESDAHLAYGARWFLVDLPTADVFEQRRVHAKGPFNAVLDGFDYWAVTLDLDVDESPALGWMNA